MSINPITKAKPYWPLIALVGTSALAATAINPGDTHMWMHYFMGFFLCVFSLLKIFDPASFAKGFAKYDLLAKRSRTYGMFYPFIELALGLGYLSFWQPAWVYTATIVVLGFGTIGVLTALRAGLNINCPCMGNILKVPLSTVTLTENLSMVAMAAFMLFAM